MRQTSDECEGCLFCGTVHLEVSAEEYETIVRLVAARGEPSERLVAAFAEYYAQSRARSARGDLTPVDLTDVDEDPPLL
jgi:hypothetical protein